LKHVYSLREDLRYLNWLFNPFQRLDARRIYDLISTTSPTDHGLYLNLGYWNGAATLDQASEALAMLVADAAGIGRGDTVVDCGFGFGDQDILWASRLEPQRIIGLNITASQVHVARQRVAKTGLADRMDLREASATAMPLDDASVDKVVALECAFHFRTREDFFHEALRVLRPGGRLVTADIIPTKPAADFKHRLLQRLSWGLTASKFAIPDANAYPRAGYHARLLRTGFSEVRVESIRDCVYAPLHRYLQRHNEGLQRLNRVARLPAHIALAASPKNVYAGLDYVLASAVKPHA
jgi:ubiquinone/menaquinone biosynthesis C-methylase UbiE